VWVYLALFLAMVLGRLVPELDRLAWELVTSGGDGSLTWTWVAALATAQACNPALHWRLRVVLGAAVAALLIYAVGEAREWVSGWLPSLVAVAVVLGSTWPRLAAAAMIAGAAGALFNLPRVLRHVMWGDNRYSLATRFDAGRILAEITAANPLTGLGPSNYYHATPLFEIRGYHVHFSSHSNYIDLIAQTGVIGLACLLWWCWLLAREGWRVRASAPAGFPRSYAHAALGGLAGTLTAAALGDWMLPFVYNVSLDGLRSSLPAFLFLGGLVGLGRSLPGNVTAPAWLPGRRWFVEPRRALPAIIGIAVGLRVATAIWLGDTAAPVSGAFDQTSYDVLAQRVLGGHGFSFAVNWYPFTAPDEPTAHWSFLYTLYLAGVYAVGGHHPLAARLLQALASGAGCWLIFRIGRRLFDSRVGLAAAALTALYAYFILFNAALMTQTFFILAVLCALDCALAIAERPSPRAWAALGLSLGIGALLRQTVLLFAPLLLIWLIVVTPGRRRWRGAAAAAGLIALCVLPWTVRNYLAFGDFLLLNSNGGYFFYAANHPDQGTTFSPYFAPPLPETLYGRGEPAIDRALFRTALGFITADPRRFLNLAWDRIGDYYQMRPSPKSSWIANVGRGYSFTLYAPFMLYGLVRSRSRWRACVPLYLYLGVDTALHLSSWAAPRYRLPSDAVMMVFAGLALVDLCTRLHRFVNGTAPTHDLEGAAPSAPHPPSSSQLRPARV
jgi:hypothetical protein